MPDAGMGSLSRRLKQMQAGDWLGEAIDSAKDFYEPEQWIEPNVEIHPSGAGGKCAREVQFSLLGHRTEILRQNRRRMDNGTAAHLRWTEDLEKMGLLYAAGVRHKIPGEWSGEYDLICRNSSTGRLHLGEIKTMNEARFRRVPAQGPDFRAMAYELAKSERKYVYQLTQYLVVFKRDVYPELSDEVFFLFEDTNTQNFGIRWLAPDDRMKEEAFKVPEVARLACLEGELLPPPFKRGSLECRSCYRERVCYEEQDGSTQVRDALAAALHRTKHGLHENVARHEGRPELVTAPVRVRPEVVDDLLDWE